MINVLEKYDSSKLSQEEMERGGQLSPLEKWN